MNKQEKEGLEYSIEQYQKCGAKLEPFVRPSEWDGSDVSIKCEATDKNHCATRIMTGMWLIKGEHCKYPK